MGIGKTLKISQSLIVDNHISLYMNGSMPNQPSLDFDPFSGQVPPAKRGVEGTSGTRIYGGYIYEEYLAQLTTAQRALSLIHI